MRFIGTRAGVIGTLGFKSCPLQPPDHGVGLQLLSGIDGIGRRVKTGGSLENFSVESPVNHLRVIAVIVKGYPGKDDEDEQKQRQEDFENGLPEPS